MPDISSIGHGSVGPVERPSSTGGREHGATSSSRLDPPPSRPGDRVELSDHARHMDALRQLPGVRRGIVDRVREEIAAGTYETEEKLHEAIEHLIDDLLIE